MEFLIIKYLKKLIKIDDESTRIPIFEKMTLELEETFKNPSERVVLQYFDYLSWTKSKAQQIPFASAVQARQAELG